MTIRFPADVPVEKWPSLYRVFTAMAAGLWSEAKLRWEDNLQDCLDSAGAIQMGYEAFIKVPEVSIGPWNPDASGYQLVSLDDKSRFVGWVDVPFPPYQQASPIFRVSLSDSSGNKTSQIQLSTTRFLPVGLSIRPGQQGSPTPSVAADVSFVAGSRVYYAMCCAESGALTVKLRVDVPTAV